MKWRIYEGKNLIADIEYDEGFGVTIDGPEWIQEPVLIFHPERGMGYFSVHDGPAAIDAVVRKRFQEGEPGRFRVVRINVSLPTAPETARPRLH